MSNYKYSLEKYRNRNQKHNCPRCDDRSFVRYINNDTGDYLHNDVGRCDHQDGCGYHYTPKEYHKNNMIITTDKNYKYDTTSTNSKIRTAVPCTTSTNSTNSTNQEKEEIDSIPFKYIEQAAKTRNKYIY